MNQPSISNPQLLDKIVEEINAAMELNISWLNKAYRIAETRKHEEGDLYPGVRITGTSGNNYLSMLPDGSLGNYSWVQRGGTETVVNEHGRGNYQIIQDLNFIFHFDFRDLAAAVGTDPEAYTIENLKRELLGFFDNYTFFSCRAKAIQFEEAVDAIYSGYTYTETLDQFAMRPYGVLSITVEVNYFTDDCLGTFPTVLLPTTTFTGVEEAPLDGNEYTRKNATWVISTGGTGGVEEAPIDGTEYIRQNGAWAPLSIPEQQLISEHTNIDGSTDNPPDGSVMVFTHDILNIWKARKLQTSDIEGWSEPANSTIDNDYGDETVASTWTFSGLLTIPEASVTAHEAALTITKSQISDYVANLAEGDINPDGSRDINLAVGHSLGINGNTQFTNNTLFPLRLTALRSDAAGGTNLGVGIQFDIEDSASTNSAGNIEVEWIDGTSGSLRSQMYLRTRNQNFGIIDALTIDPDGRIGLPEYRKFNELTGTRHRNLATDEDGRIIQYQDSDISITESQISDFGAYLTDAPSDGNQYVRKDAAWVVNSGGGGATQLSELSDVNTSTPTNRNVLIADGIDWESRALTEADISDLQAYLTTEANDLTAAVVWANVPDANITQSSVTQHQAALSINESQISDLQSYLLNITAEPLSDLNDVTITTIAAGEILKWSGTVWINNTLSEAGIEPAFSKNTGFNLNLGTIAGTVAEGNHTHTAANITDFDTEVSNNASVTANSAKVSADGSITSHSDILSATITNRNVLVANGTTGFESRPLVEADISDLGTYLTAFTDIDTDYGAETVASDWIFQGGGAAGDYSDVNHIDLTIGNSANYGLLDIGSATFGRTSRVTGNLDLEGSVIIRNNTTPNTSNIIFALMEGVNEIRLAIPKSGVGNATYNPRSMIIAGPAPADDAAVTVGYWQGQGIFENLAMDTGTNGADLGVQNDLEVEGQIFVDTIVESTAAAGVTIDGLLIKDGSIPQVAVTEHQAALSVTASQVSDFDTEVSNNTDVAANTLKVSFPEAPNDGQEYVRKNLAWAVASGGGASQLSDLSDVNTSTPTNRFVLIADGVDFESRALVEADISDFGTYLTTEVNDLTSAVTWANVPDANITASSVEQHLKESKSITIESPTSSEDISIFFTNRAITITEIRAVVRGTSPSVTWTVRHGTDRSATGAEAVTSGTTTTSQTTGSDVTSFNDATIVADSFVWLETTAQSGTVDEMNLTIYYTID